MEKLQNVTLGPQQLSKYVTQSGWYKVKTDQLQFSNCVIRNTVIDFPIYLRSTEKDDKPEKQLYVFEGTVLENCTLQVFYPSESHFKNRTLQMFYSCEFYFKDCTIGSNVHIYYDTSSSRFFFFDDNEEDDALDVTTDTILRLYEEFSNEEIEDNHRSVKFTFENCVVDNKLVEKLVIDHSVMKKYKEHEEKKCKEQNIRKVEFGM